MQTLWQDLRYGARMLMKEPGFTLIAVLSLALGIGANTAIFSLVNEVLFKPLPFPDAERLVMVWEEASFADFPLNDPSPANYADWKAQNKVFQDMAALDTRSFNLIGDGEPLKVQGYGVSAGFFPLLGVQPAMGRTFLPSDDKPDAAKVAVISYRLWQNRYGGERSIIGRDILLSGEKHTVVGVMPAGFQFLESYIGLWVPQAFTAEQMAARGDHYLTVVARLKPGVTREQAQADMETVMAGIRRDYPEEAGRSGITVLSLRDQLAGKFRRPLMILLAAVGFVLLIACANVANLLLSRAVSRRKEIAVRTALGASRWQVIRQLLTESILLSVVSGIAGLLLASWSFEFLQRLVPAEMSLAAKMALDWQVLGVAMLVSVVTGILFGLVPALQASRVDLNEVLKQGGGRSGANVVVGKLRGAMIVVEMAMSLVLLTGAALMIQTVFHLLRQYSGIKPENVLTMRTALPDNKYPDHSKRVAFYSQVLERVKTLPGVTDAGYSTSVPLEWKGGSTGIAIEGRQPEPGVFLDANHRQVSADYLKAMGIALRQGCHLGESDNEQSMAVGIINETMAAKYWPGENAIGKRFKPGKAESPRQWVTIVGIAADVRQMGADLPAKAEIYLPYRQVNYFQWFAPRDLVIRTAADPMSLVSSVRQEIRAVDPEQPVSNIRKMSEILGAETAPRRVAMILFTAFAGLALLLAAFGIYGALSYFVAQQTPEIGLRMALGARQADVLALVLKKGMTLAVIGVGVGLVAAFALTRLMKTLLYGVASTDPLTFVGVAALLTLVALLACWIPARRATKVDPMIALRCD